MTVEEKVAMTKVAETITFENGRYTVGIPWREGEPRLGNNYDAALGRLQSQEKSLKPKGPDIMKQYSHIFEIRDKGTVVPPAFPRDQTR